MADIQSEIAARRKKAADLRRQADMLEAEARGMEIAAHFAAKSNSPPPLPQMKPMRDSPAASSLPPPPPSPPPSPPLPPPPEYQATLPNAPRRGGRQKGAISKVWRSVLMDLRRRYPDGFSENEVCEVAADHEELRNLRAKDARDRMRSYVDSGYTEQVGNGFRVTDFAADKFSQETMLY